MPMLHGCAFPGCETFTLNTYCVEHEHVVRALKESERAAHAASLHGLATDVSAALATAPGRRAHEPAQV